MFELIEQGDEHQGVNAGGDADETASGSGTAEAREPPETRAGEDAGEQDGEEHFPSVSIFDNRAGPPEHEGVAQEVPEAVMEQSVREPLPDTGLRFGEFKTLEEVGAGRLLDEFRNEED